MRVHYVTRTLGDDSDKPVVIQSPGPVAHIQTLPVDLKVSPTSGQIKQVAVGSDLILYPTHLSPEQIVELGIYVLSFVSHMRTLNRSVEVYFVTFKSSGADRFGLYYLDTSEVQPADPTARRG